MINTVHYTQKFIPNSYLILVEDKHTLVYAYTCYLVNIEQRLSEQFNPGVKHAHIILVGIK